MPIGDEIEKKITDQLTRLPLKLSVREAAEVLGEKVGTAHTKINRGTFPITIHQIEGAQRFVLLADLAKFLTDGLPQPQPELIKRAARNPLGFNGKKKRGRPSHATRALAKQQTELNSVK